MPLVLMRVLQSASLAMAMATGACSGGDVPAAGPPAPEPRVGQPGKDVVWVPTPETLVERMLDLAKITSSDYVFDLGSGDGRTVIAAAKRGARAKGIEFNPDLVRFATAEARAAGLSWRATFEQGDIFTADLRAATVITLFLSSQINLTLRPRLLELEAGTRIVSNTFTMDNWDSDATSQAGDCRSWCDAHLWIIPSKVDGRWDVDGDTLDLTQLFQRVNGTWGAAPVEGRLRGAEVTLTVGPRRFTGRVTRDRITGTRDDGARWVATRRGPVPAGGRPIARAREVYNVQPGR